MDSDEPQGYRELLAATMMRGGLATGHGDTFEDLLSELEGQLLEFQTHIAAAESSLARSRKALDVIAPAVESLACHQVQCDEDGVMVQVSRQAVDEVVNSINQLAIDLAALQPDGESK